MYRVDALELLELTLLDKSQHVVACDLDVPVVLGEDVHDLVRVAVVPEPDQRTIVRHLEQIHQWADANHTFAQGCRS